MLISPLFSILIANYNNGKYLLEAIDSVRNQSYSSWEIIIIDDDSNDNSKELYLELEKDERIRIFLNSENRGCGYTKHRCVEEATGEICAFLDPDDTITPDALEVMAQAHSTNLDASIVYSTHYLCDEYLNIKEINTTVGEIPKNHSYLSSRLQPIRVSALASFKKQLYDTTLKINPNLKRAVDQDLYYKLEETGPLVYLNLPLYYYRWHSGGISTLGNSLKARYWHTLVLKDAYRRRRDKPQLKNISAQDLKLYLSQFYTWKAMEKQQKKELCKMYYMLILSFKHSLTYSLAIRAKMALSIIKVWKWV